MGYPPLARDGVLPRNRTADGALATWYASCVHAGGVSCLLFFPTMTRLEIFSCEFDTKMLLSCEIALYQLKMSAIFTFTANCSAVSRVDLIGWIIAKISSWTRIFCTSQLTWCCACRKMHEDQSIIREILITLLQYQSTIL